jgi:hypothetical protein
MAVKPTIHKCSVKDCGFETESERGLKRHTTVKHGTGVIAAAIKPRTTRASVGEWEYVGLVNDSDTVVMRDTDGNLSLFKPVAAA